MERYVLQRSKEDDNVFLVTDTVNKIVCRFEFGKFNETQKFTPLEDLTDEQVKNMPHIMSELGDWMAQNHYFVAMPYGDDECRYNLAQMLRRLREEQHLSVYQLSKTSGVQEINIHRIEQGKYSARFDTIIKLLNAMKKDIGII